MSRPLVKCPRCGSMAIEETCLGFIGGPGNFDDVNRAKCDSCQHRGTVGDWQRLAMAGAVWEDLGQQKARAIADAQRLITALVQRLGGRVALEMREVMAAGLQLKQYEALEQVGDAQVQCVVFEVQQAPAPPAGETPEQPPRDALG